MENLAREARKRRRSELNQRNQTNRSVDDERSATQPICNRSRNLTRQPNTVSQKKTTNTSEIDLQTISVSNLGEPQHTCKFCGALFWYQERKRKQRETSNLEFNLCCRGGQVQIPVLKSPPPLLDTLLDSKGGQESRIFREKIRMYNSIFAFTSMGGKIDKTLNNGTTPYAFRISGQNYHLMGSLVPSNGKTPKFLQLYIYDTDNEVKNRISTMNGEENTNSMGLNENLVKELIKMLDENNELVKVFRMARDRFKEDDMIPIRVKLLGNRSKDSREYNLPTASEIAALIVGDLEDTVGYRDIIVEHKGNGTQQIDETHPSFMAMQYPLLFPYGEDGIQQRRTERSALLRGGHLFLQYLVDAYTCIEAERLRFLRYNQKLLRIELYDGLADAIARGDTDASSLGRRIVLPSTFTGGPRYKVQNYQDAMAICRVYGNPDLFITFTANTKWPEIQAMLSEIPGQKADDRPAVYTIEFQKRGLPRAHILLFLHPDHKCKTAADIDNIISAEIPDPDDHEAYNAVKQFMIHGPCGNANKKATCMSEGKCTKHYPKRFYCESTLDDDGFPIYRKRDNGRNVVKNGIKFDNRDIYQAHINVEWCNKSRSIKYLFKREEYLNCRYVSACEAVWRIYQFDINYRSPSVQRLGFHLPNKQTSIFTDHKKVSGILSRPNIETTMFTKWLEANKRYVAAKELIYAEFPEKKKGKTIGRLVYAHPTSGERFYLRLLLSIVKGPTSYEDIRTYNGTTYPTFKEACYARGLLDGDKEWNDALQEASRWANASQLRQLFVTMLLFCEVSEPMQLWENNWTLLSDDVLYNHRRLLRYSELQMTEDQLKNYTLFEIEKLLLKNKRDELRLNTKELLQEHLHLHAGLNTEQKIIYNKVVEAALTGQGGLFFIYGHGGTGKTYVYKTIISRLRSEENIVLAVASSGIASLLLPLGRTAHSRFDIPIKLTDTSTCNIAQGTPQAYLIKKAKLIVWDEAPMTHRHAFEAVNRTICDILQHTHDDEENTIFGGKKILLGGDFRQILPVVSKGKREDIVRASISKSKLWDQCQVFTLTQNMRLTQAQNDEDKEKVTEFGKWILSLGDGKLPMKRGEGEEEPTWIEIPQDLLIDPKENPLEQIVATAYPNLESRYKEASYLRDMCILAPRNETVDEINAHIMENLPEQSRTYKSSDSICRSSGSVNDQDILYPVEFLNSLKFNGIPDHELKLKVGTPIMLLRNINQTEGLCNGTRLIITHLADWVIEAEIITRKNIGSKAFIPRIMMSPTESKWPFEFRRRQFPVKIYYAMIINKSQGQTLNNVALYLPEPVFSHGQLYVAVSRVTSREGLRIIINNKGHMPPNYTKNIVYKEIFEDLQSGML
ncbi:hypothetical protein RND81_05G136000 [Saponaria officinalis]|uniref:ATP-dependent DNA helicase n=1 Tax=Saponaria officinalis TaxID=3572 RepID=A0AAW1L0N1_SAPOF